MITTKRIYEPVMDEDGFRILVDRLWPRGMAKSKAEVHYWCKEVAPGTELRKWFAHEPAKWSEFRERYKEELKGKTILLRHIKELEEVHGKLSLLYAARTPTHHHALILQEVLNALF